MQGDSLIAMSSTTVGSEGFLELIEAEPILYRLFRPRATWPLSCISLLANFLHAARCKD